MTWSDVPQPLICVETHWEGSYGRDISGCLNKRGFVVLKVGEVIRYCIYDFCHLRDVIFAKATYEANPECIKTEGMLHNYADMFVVVTSIFQASEN